MLVIEVKYFRFRETHGDGLNRRFPWITSLDTQQGVITN